MPNSTDLDHNAQRLHAYDQLAGMMSCAVAVVETEPAVELRWLNDSPLAQHFPDGGPSVSGLFAAAHSENRERLADFWEQMLTEPYAMVELQLSTPSGDECWYRAQSTVATRPDGTDYLIFCCSNIDQMLAGQEEVIERRRKETIHDMAAGIAHEFNNNLTPIRGFIELTLDMMDASHPAYDGLQTALNQAEVCADLVRQIMFSSSKSILNLRRLDLTKLLSNIVYDASQSGIIPSDAIRIIEHLQDLPPVWIDHDVFRDAIRHLISNAVTAMPEGGTLSISLQPADSDAILARGSDGDFVLIKIEDDGIGIAAADMRRIFDPFFTTRNRAEARGMGLPMVQGMVTQMGGWIQIESCQDHGTSVMLFLPVDPAEHSDPTPHPLYNRVGDPSTSKVAVGTMLVADDEDYVLKLITRVFGKAGWDLVEATSFYEVLNAVESNPNYFDVLILDISMPGPSAEESIDRIRNAGCKAHIMLVSGFPANERIDNLVKRSNGTFISKPFSLSAIVKQVEQLREFDD